MNIQNEDGNQAKRSNKGNTDNLSYIPRSKDYKPKINDILSYNYRYLDKNRFLSKLPDFVHF